MVRRDMQNVVALAPARAIVAMAWDLQRWFCGYRSRQLV